MMIKIFGVEIFQEKDTDDSNISFFYDIVILLIIPIEKDSKSNEPIASLDGFQQQRAISGCEISP